MKNETFNPSYLFTSESTWKTILDLLESTNTYDEQKFIVIWNDLDLVTQLSILSYKYERPNLLKNASENLCLALLNSKFAYVRYKLADEMRFTSKNYPSVVERIENDPDPLVKNAIYEFSYKKPFLNDGKKTNSNDSHLSTDFVSHLLDSDSKMRRAILVGFNTPSICKIINIAIELTYDKKNNGISTLMSLCKDITWRDNDYYKRNNYFSDYEYDEKRKSSSNDLWTTASNLCKRKSYITIAKYIASNLPYPPDECILENLHEMVLVEALERIDLNATEFREKIVLNTSSEALLKAASKYNLCLSDEVVNSFISNPSKQHIAKELCYSYSISPSHWLAFNEATNDQPSLTELVDHIDMYSGIYRREGFCPVDYHDAALIVFARSLVDKSKGSKYYYLDYDDELPFPFGFIDLVTFRWLKASRYHHLLAIAKRTVQACSKYVDVNSVWKTYLNIKASNITITSLLLLVPKLVYLDKKDGKSTVSDYERLTKSNFDKLPKHTTTTSLSYYIASTLRELPTYISSLQRNAHNNLLKDITILILICTISILLFK